MPCCDWDDEADLEGYGHPVEDEADPVDDATVPCRHCRESVFEDAERCSCWGRYLSREDPFPRRHPWRFVIEFLLCMLVLLGWVIWK